MLKLSRREEDFDSLNQYNQFLNKTIIGKILKKYNIYSDQGLRYFCLNELGGGDSVFKFRLRLEELCLVVYAIKTGVITLKEYVDTYNGDEDFFNYRFLNQYKIHKNFIDEVMKNVYEGKELNELFISLPSSAEYDYRLEKIPIVLKQYNIPFRRSAVAEFCRKLIYENNRPNEFIYKTLLTNAEFIVLCIRGGVIEPTDLVPDQPFDSIYFISFVDKAWGSFEDDEESLSIQNFLNHVGEITGIYDMFFTHKDDIFKEIIDKNDIKTIHLLLYSDIINHEDKLKLL